MSDHDQFDEPHGDLQHGICEALVRDLRAENARLRTELENQSRLLGLVIAERDAAEERGNIASAERQHAQQENERLKAEIDEYSSIIVEANTRENEKFRDGYQRSRFSSRACPGCEYREGVFIKPCVLHDEADAARLAALLECSKIVENYMGWGSERVISIRDAIAALIEKAKTEREPG